MVKNQKQTKLLKLGSLVGDEVYFHVITGLLSVYKTYV